MKKHTFTVIDKNGRKHTATTLVPDSRPNPGTSHKYRTAKGEFQGQFLSGRQHGSSRADLNKIETTLNHMQAFFQKHHGMKDSWKGIKKWQSDSFEDYIKSKPSLLTGKMLDDKTQKDILGNYRKVMTTLGKEHMLPQESFVARGIAVSRNDLEKPIDFKPTYKEEREALQQMLESGRNKWYPVASQLGQAFGLRLAERMASRDIIYRKGDSLYATHKLEPARKVSIQTLQERYGDKYINRLIDQKTGEWKIPQGIKHLIVEDAKGDRTRNQAIYNDARKEAVERLHNFIRNSSGRGEHMKVHPDKITSQNAKESYSKFLQRHGIDRSTDLHTHGDRHAEAQRMFAECRENGMSWKEAAVATIVELGHDDPSGQKIYYYIHRK